MDTLKIKVMKILFLFVCSLLLLNPLFGQDIDDNKYVSAITFLKQNKELKKELRKAKFISRRQMCSDLNFIIADSLFFLSSSEFSNTGISLFKSSEKYDEEYFFKPLYAGDLKNLEYLNFNCAVIFSKPVQNTLILEIVPVSQLKSAFTKPRLGTGIKVLLVFENNDSVESYFYETIAYN